MGCQREIAQQIVDGGADYVLAVKENQGQLYQGIRDLFQEAEASDFDGVPYDCAQTVNKGHGRVERRECWVVTAADCLDYLDPQGQWPQLKAAIKVVGHRKTAAGSASQPRHYISSLAAPAENCWLPSGAIGASRTRCIGPWMQPFTKTSAECGKACPLENGGSWAAKHGHATADRAQSVEKGEHPQSRHPRQTAQRRLECRLPAQSPPRIRRDCPAFDDHRLVANAGLILPVILAQRLGFGELVDRHVDLGRAPGRANAGDKMMTLVASALAGGDCIDDADALRSFRWAHVRQLDRVSRELLAQAWAAGGGPGDAPFTIDLDSTICETYGLAKERPAPTTTAASGAITRCWPWPRAPGTC